jgi:hypothetical protein
MGPPEHPAVMRRAREVASRQYYPPSPETPSLNSVTRSMRSGDRRYWCRWRCRRVPYPSAMHSSNNNSLIDPPTWAARSLRQPVPENNLSTGDSSSSQLC